MKTIIALYYNKLRFALADRFPGRVHHYGTRAVRRMTKQHKVGPNTWRFGDAKIGPIMELLPRREPIGCQRSSSATSRAEPSE